MTKSHPERVPAYLQHVVEAIDHESQAYRVSVIRFRRQRLNTRRFGPERPFLRRAMVIIPSPPSIRSQVPGSGTDTERTDHVTVLGAVGTTGEIPTSGITAAAVPIDTK